MKPREQKIDLGTLKINHEVIASIARKAALEVEGVIAVKQNIWSHALSVFTHNPRYHGIELHIQDGEVAIDMTLMVQYGVHIPELAATVQENIRKIVEDMTGLTVSAVNVSIADIQPESEGERSAT